MDNSLIKGHICDECMQYYTTHNPCFCNGGKKTAQYINVVKGCINIKLNKRCKKKCTMGIFGILDVCSLHKKTPVKNKSDTTSYSSNSVKSTVKFKK